MLALPAAQSALAGLPTAPACPMAVPFAAVAPSTGARAPASSNPPLGWTLTPSALTLLFSSRQNLLGLLEITVGKIGPVSGLKQLAPRLAFGRVLRPLEVTRPLTLAAVLRVREVLGFPTSLGLRLAQLLGVVGVGVEAFGAVAAAGRRADPLALGMPPPILLSDLSCS